MRLYAANDAVSVSRLALDLEQNKLSNYTRVLDSLHGAKFIEYNKAKRYATLSALGIREVEERLFSS